MKKLKSAILGGVAMVMAALPFSDPAGAEERLTVVELFTSQGCHSCPPADAYLGELAKNPNILALSFHVDYWNYLGWRDVFSDPAYTQRQRDYSTQMRSRYVYTPQLVINGTFEHPGHRKRTIRKTIATLEALPVTPVLEPMGNSSAKLKLPSMEQTQLAIWLVGYDLPHEIAINAGENSGKALTYHNVVREMRYLGSWDGEARTMDVALDRSSTGGMAVLLQQPEGGPIVGAARIRFDVSS